MVEAGLALRAYNSPEYIKDAGTPSRLEQVRRHFESGLVQRSSLMRKQQAVFIDRDGTLNQDNGHITRAEDLHVFPFVGAALKRLNAAEWRTVVVTNQPVLARGEASEVDLRRIHAKLDTEVARDNAIIDRLYVCPHHPDSGYQGEVAHLKIDCSCRKPKAGLIFQAADDLNIDLAKSWFIGDSTADLGAAESARMSSVLVRTGGAGFDDRYPYEVGFSQPDFSKAVDFILDLYPGLAVKCAPIIDEVVPGQNLFLGGLARSGKSTIAATLMRELRLAGRDVVVIHLDRWILNESDRLPGVFGRFDMNAIREMYEHASSRSSAGTKSVSLKLPSYSRRTRRQMDAQYDVSLGSETIVIWEGVVALELAARLNELQSTLAVCGNSEARKARFHEYDRYRGVPEVSSSISWQKREEDEHNIVELQIGSARFLLFLDDVMS
jgi:D,D-heptose 1,7-bisphosphate phosphatase